jgi:hypothetical protein
MVAAREVREVLRAATPTHRRLRDVLVAIVSATIGIDLLCAIAAFLLERHAHQTEIHTFGSAAFWITTQRVPTVVRCRERRQDVARVEGLVYEYPQRYLLAGARSLMAIPRTRRAALRPCGACLVRGPWVRRRHPREPVAGAPAGSGSSAQKFVRASATGAGVSSGHQWPTPARCAIFAPDRPRRSAKGSATARGEQTPIPKRWPCPSLASYAGSHCS